jgi:hypothetical protein
MAVLFGIPAIAVPLLATIVAMSAPAALIAGIAAIAIPAQHGRDGATMGRSLGELDERPGEAIGQRSPNR